MDTLRSWIISVIGEPTFYQRVQISGTNYQTVTVQYDWAFILAGALMVISLWGFITILRCIFTRWRR